MLLETYDKQGLLFITSVLGATSKSGISAFRGDLILIQGSLREGSDTDRKPPELLLHQVAALADDNKFLFISGLFHELKDVVALVEKYQDALKADTVTLFFVENIAKPMQVVINDVLFKFIPFKEGMIWNETLEMLYIEKADLKGQTAEDKVITVYEAAQGFSAKTETIDFAEALTKTIVVKKSAAVGPV